MEVITDIFARYFTNTAIALGNFDGMHVGHQEILKSCVLNAKHLNLTPCVMTFNPHPREILSSNKHKSIMNFEDRLAIFRTHGIEKVFAIAFDAEFASISATEFIEDILIKQLGAKYVTTGYNFYFGHNREGDHKLLARYSSNFKYNMINRISYNYHEVSTSNIKAMLQLGACGIVSKILGRSHSITGKVVEGKQNARTIGFRTANIEIDDTLLLHGVYLVTVLVTNEQKWGVASIGINHSVNYSIPILEVHILDFNQNIYEKDITVTFINFIRPERKFANLDELKFQIKMDIDSASLTIRYKT